MVKTMIPWWIKIIAKIILSRLPLGYSFWQHLGFFRHGYMDQTSYVIDIFNEHILRAGLEGKLQGKTILELGPGDSIATAIVAACFGANSVLIDAGPFAKTDLAMYHRLVDDLKKSGFEPPDISKIKTFEELLHTCNAKYLTQGLESFSSIKTETIDLIFSQAVLEHIRKHEFTHTLNECFRVLTPKGVISHRVDLKDHLSGSLNNLRFSDRIWESKLFVRSGFYTNRIRYPEMIKLFKNSGFDVHIDAIRKWDCLPLKKSYLAMHFLSFSDKDLVIKGFDTLLRKTE